MEQENQRTNERTKTKTNQLLETITLNQQKQQQQQTLTRKRMMERTKEIIKLTKKIFYIYKNIID